ncbi:MAG: class I SAM-dependent methyltransferase [Balneolaceae bacterium]
MEMSSKQNSAASILLSNLPQPGFANSIRSVLRTGAILTGLFILAAFHHLKAQDLDVPYVPTPNQVVEGMLDAADVGPGDYVIDLGSGDGRIVIAAAQRGAVGHGVDLNPERISEAEDNARAAGVTDRVMFLEGDIFETDFSKASVITMYLLSSVNRELRPSLLENLRPGTRIVSHSFDMGEWEPDEELRIDNRTVYYWVIPADVEGGWQWEANGNQFSMSIRQQYQNIDVNLRAGNRTLTTKEAVLNGDRMSLIIHDPNTDSRYVYSGTIEGDSITGTVQIRENNSSHIEEWSATLD